MRTALIFGGLLSALFIAAEAVARTAGDSGVYAMAALAGLVDVDAIGLALARSAGRGLSEVGAQRAIVVAVLVNTAVKAVLAAALGGRSMLRFASVILASALACGAIVAWVTLS